jgi:hypothetical protein
MTQEHRTQARLKCHARVMVTGSARWAVGEVHDVSDAGVCLVTADAYEKGTTLHLQFELPEGSVEAQGEVRWVGPLVDGQRELGVRFVRINAPSSKVIARAMEVRPFRSQFFTDYVMT